MYISGPICTVYTVQVKYAISNVFSGGCIIASEAKMSFFEKKNHSVWQFHNFIEH